MMLDKLFEPDSLRAEASGMSVGLRLPWYRALPLSTVEIDAVKIDGEPVGADRLSLSLNGGTWRVGELRDLTHENWFVTDTGTLHVEGAEVKAGETHEIEVTLSCYPPYIRGLRRATRFSRAMEVR